jgi:hypothetical protein
MVNVVAAPGVVDGEFTIAEGPPEDPLKDPEPPLIEPGPGPPEGTIRSSSRSSCKTTLRLFGDARRRLTKPPRMIKAVNRVHNVITGSFGPRACNVRDVRV